MSAILEKSFSKKANATHFKYFENVTVDELIGMKFTSKEEELVACFLKLNEENQNRIMDLIQALQPEN